MITPDGYITFECPNCFITLTLKKRTQETKICALCKYDHVEQAIKDVHVKMLTEYKDMAEPVRNSLIQKKVDAIINSFNPLPEKKEVPVEPTKKVKAPRNRKR